MTEETQDNQNIRANDNSIAVGNVTVGGSIGGNLTIGNTGFSADQVSILITQISTTFQPKPFDGRCPYKGLDVFEEVDAELFFGRERLVDNLVERVKESRTVFITGPSGSGKSSLVRAGLIHELKQGAIKESHSEGWLYATIKPGREPFEALALAFSRLKSPELGNYLRQNASKENLLYECTESALNENKNQRLVLFMDQFEEVFTQVGNEEERIAFLNLLTHAATVENGRVNILFSMRSDFVSNCATYPKLNEILNRQFIQIGAMQGNELVSAIAQPALRVGLSIDPDLIAQIINDMQGEPGALPLMQFALKDLFDSQQEKGGFIALTLNDYLGRGGIHRSLERHADKTFAEFNAQEQDLAHSIFSLLIQIGRGTQDTRRIANFDELVPTRNQTGEVETIVRKLADARLITTDEIAGKNTITLAHEKLLDAWSWLKRLVNENRETIAIQNEIAEDAQEWDGHKRDSSYLYSGIRLKGIQEWTNKHPDLLSPLSMEFLEAGQNARKREQARWVGVTAAGAVLLVMVVLGATGKLNRFIYRPVAMKDYWVTIPAGEFLMGSSAKEIAYAKTLCSDCDFSDEQPQHWVDLPEYQIGKYEVTNRQYAQCAKAGVCAGKAYAADTALHPVVNVTWYDAKTYCEWAGGRLPTEAEWEKAASWDDGTKTKRIYPWGEMIDCSYANYNGKDGGNDFCVGDTTPVGSYESGKSPYGLYDMAGNVWEWVSSLYMFYPYLADFGTEDMSLDAFRVLRGGSWTSLDYSVRSALRRSYDPANSDQDLGFRCSRDSFP